jgi:hypothetical protein
VATTTAEQTRPRVLCAESGSDPEWWVHQHPGHCPKGCPHGLAAHICLNHCPLVTSCQDRMTTSDKREFVGMVLGGLIKVGDHHGKSQIRVPLTLFQHCESCDQE